MTLEKSNRRKFEKTLDRELAKTENQQTTVLEKLWQYFKTIIIEAAENVCAMITGNLRMITSGIHYGWPSLSLPKLLQNDSHIPITSDEGSWIATAYARSVTILMIARYLAGISDGLICFSVPIYFGEIADPNIRGLLGSVVSVAWIFGILVTYLLGSYLSIADTALISLIIPMLLPLTFPFIPESSYYLLMKGKIKDARDSLMVFKRTNNVEDELNRLKEAVKEQNKNTGKYLDLFTVKKARDSVSPAVASIIYFSVQLVLSAVCSVIVDKTGRKPLMIIFVIDTGIALLTEGVYFYIKNTTDIDVSRYSSIPVVALITCVIMFALGLQTIPVILLGEIFPTNVKAFAVSFSDNYFAVITIVSKFFQVTKDNFGMHILVFAFAGCCVIGLLFVIFSLPETEGKTLEDIQEELKEEKSKKDHKLRAENIKKLDNAKLC
ncbi:hypothetical protein ILUMI_14169 [Ignelater luminosus]|uniref:Major facilitator superfamily (MFS) profile domain-containing protein n=1 Tax=Ignelater luminosus TaxID=2038154 RepID=A0A8K0GA86_IGNLU|nr:hypothetical protein ILUMI_14169 [Ignelater luminosus]